MNVKKISDHAECLEEAAVWFSQKWNLPVSAYRESMLESINKKTGIPEWYIVDNGGDIVAGAGFVVNDFHDRKDLSPNICALFVEEEYRGKGIARHILDVVRKESAATGFEKLYLVTAHTGFYEKCGWHFLTMVNDMGGGSERMYIADTLG